jgi:hypothetical protein
MDKETYFKYFWKISSSEMVRRFRCTRNCAKDEASFFERGPCSLCLSSHEYFSFLFPNCWARALSFMSHMTIAVDWIQTTNPGFEDTNTDWI